MTPVAQGVVVRPMAETDSAVVQALAVEAFDDLLARQRQSESEHTPERTRRGQARVRHCLGTDPGGAWLAEIDGRVVGCALALRRGQRLFGLSLLVVSPANQGQGIGSALFARTLDYARDCVDGLIVASADPRAMHAYAGAGFRLEPAYSAVGAPDRRALPVVAGVREGRSEDLELIAAVDVGLRGAAHGDDMRFYLDNGYRVLIAERGPDRGYVVTQDGSPALLGATSTGIAQDLLWTVLADSAGIVEVADISARQQWAIEVVHRARLSLSPLVATICVRGDPGPLAPYLPSGPFL